MEVPFGNTSLDLLEGFHVREACQHNTQVGNFQMVNPTFSPMYSSLGHSMNSVNSDGFKKEYAYGAELPGQVIPPFTATNFGPQNPVPTSISSTSVTYSPGVFPHPCISETSPCSASPSTSIDLQDYTFTPSVKRRPRGWSVKQRATTSTRSFDDQPVSLSTKDSQVSSSDCNSDCSVVTGSSDKTRAMNKDDRYIQRRLKNNLAAKRSRDNRKRREDTIASHARFLERSNIILQAQVLALKKEVCSLRGIPYDPNYKVQVLNDNYLSSCQALSQSTISCVFPNEYLAPSFSLVARSNQLCDPIVPYPPITEFSGSCR